MKLTFSDRIKCPRKLAPGEAKRYMHVGPLVGYYVGCPACGFVESHTDLHGEHGFTEEDGVLVAAARGWKCMLCERSVTVLGGVVTAVLDSADPPL